ncbi:hypothetical protein, partial [Lysinibacillus sphaericus]|uniref:hypothetical protein n=1 Tax=Lysinibacillus sphaericus TaxID=1421 RepID=UPI00055DE912
HAGDAYFCCHEFKETNYLDVADSLREHLCSKRMLDSNDLLNIENKRERKMTKVIESKLLDDF